MINIEKEILSDGSTKFTMTEETKKVIDSDKYIEFVRQTTSPASSDFAQLLSRMTELVVWRTNSIYLSESISRS